MYSFSQLQDIVRTAISKSVYPAYLPELYDPVAYIMNLQGKRLRPCLVLMGCNLFSDTVEEALDPALGIELFHNFTLMHDDIMDKAPLRRGAATVHEKWDPNTAILSGDVMLVEAYKRMARIKPPFLEQVLNIFSRTAARVCEGQQLDMNFEKRQTVSISDYLQMIELKTAVLLGASLEIGAVTGGAGGKEAEELYEFGKNLGIAFQLQDDYLDLYGNPEKFGKQVGGDVLAGKKTYLLIKAFETAGEAEREELKKWMRHGLARSGVDQAEPVAGRPGPAAGDAVREADGAVPEAGCADPAEKVRNVRKLFDALHIPEKIKAETKMFISRAFAHLDRVSAAAERKSVLKGFAESLLLREK